MNYDEFTRVGFSRYEQFARTVADISRAAIDAQPHDFRVQQIMFRAKDPTSLRRKLNERGLLESTRIEEELKDLAGCRIIFYTNTDIDRFLNSRLIFENFVMDFDGSKIHHAVGSERQAEDLYFAIHYLVSLTEERLSLPEYARYRGMRCEVQLQTILNHAWAETSHDILYHPISMQGFGTKQFDEIKKRLAKIMNQYLLPAGYEFQKVQHDYERLLQGKELFDRGTLEALGQARNNNERYEQLQRIRKDLLPFYDDVPSVAPEVIRQAAEAIKSGRDSGPVPIETPFGSFAGHTVEQVSNEALQLIDDLRYVDVELTFRTLCELYLSARSDEERKRVLQSFEALGRNEIRIWNQVAFGVQKALLDALRAQPEADRERLRPVIISLGSLFLDTELQGTAWHFESVTLQRGAVRASTSYGDFRREVLTVLFDLYRKSASLGEKLAVIQALSTATHFPMDGGRDDLIEMVLDDTRQVVEFFTAAIDGEPFEILQHLEHQYLWLYRRSMEIAAGTAAFGVKEKAAFVVAAIGTFRDRVNSDVHFVRFKTLVGFESVFPPEWNGDAMDIESPEAYRAAKIEEYVSSITAENANEWYSIIERCAAVKSNDAAMFPSFGKFLQQLAARSPDIVIGYLRKGEDTLANFLPAILAGFEESANSEWGLTLVRDWIDQGRHLAAIAQYLRFAVNAPIELLSLLGSKVVREREANAGIGTLAAIIARELTSLVDAVFLPILRMLTELKDGRWVDATYYLKQLPALLGSLSEEQSAVVLENMLLRQRIEHHDEWILRVVAGKHPAAVWDFFKGRIDREGGSEEGRYEPIPYHMTEITKALSRDAALAVRKVRAWYVPGDHMFTYSGGRLLRNVFPVVTAEFETELIGLVRSGSVDDIDFVLSVLESYQGGRFLHEVCKELANALPEDDKRIGHLEVILESTGVVSGRFGMVQAYQRKKEEVQSWLADPRPKVRAFAERYIRTLDRSIAAEQRRSETEYELSRRDWEEE